MYVNLLKSLENSLSPDRPAKQFGHLWRFSLGEDADAEDPRGGEYDNQRRRQHYHDAQH